MPHIRNIDDPDELRPANAEGLDWVGRAPTVAPVTRVRDVLLIPTSTAEGDWDTYPPVSTPPVDLGRGLMLTEHVREFIRRLEAAGLTVEPTAGHYRVLRDGKPLRRANGMPFMLPFSPDTIRWRRAAIVELRKLGIDV
jgi:hypothetical protein